jgi:DNA invertase Pin-like site-specific DNA recombinase
MIMTEYGYSRTSTVMQEGDGQAHTLAAAGIPPERTFTDLGISGMKKSRPEFDRLLSVVTSGDTIVVPELSRLGRSVVNLITLVDDLDKRGVALRILNLGGGEVDTRTPTGRFFLTVLMALSQLERDITVARTKEGMEAARLAGKAIGAPRSLSDAQERMVIKLRKAGSKPDEIAADMGISRATAYRILKRAESAPAA